MTNEAWGYFAAYGSGLLVLGLLGGFAARVIRIPHTLMQTLLSLVGGLLLGVACLHLLPHSVEMGGDLKAIGFAFLAGILSVYLTLRFLDGPAVGAGAPETDPGHHHTHGHPHSNDAPRQNWLALTGFGVHGVLDGMAVCAAVTAAIAADVNAVWPGLAAVFAVAMHKPLDTFSAGILLESRGFRRHAFGPIVALSLVTPLVAGVLLAVVPAAIGVNADITSAAMAFGAGVLLCVALADVLPEVKFHGHDRLRLAVAMLIGVALAAGIGVLEHSSHDHDHDQHHHDHDHVGHDHA